MLKESCFYKKVHIFESAILIELTCFYLLIRRFFEKNKPNLKKNQTLLFFTRMCTFL